MKQKGWYSFLLSTPFLMGLLAILASVFRLTNLQYIEFKADEALNLFVASRPIFGHPFVPTSLASSVGVLNFPLINYLLLPAVLVSTYPPFVSFYIALINVIAIVFFFVFLQKYFGKLTAFLTSLLLAVSPWAIIYSRKIWEQDFLIPMVVLFLFSFYKSYIDKQQKYWILYGAIMMLLLQIHQTTFLLPFLITIFLLPKRVINPKLLLLGIVLGLLPTIPFAWFELTNHCPDCTAVLNAREVFTQFHKVTLIRPFQIISVGDFSSLIGSDLSTIVQRFPLIYQGMKIEFLIAFLLPIATIVFWLKNRVLSPLIYATVCLPILFFILRIDPFIHYFIVLMPLLFLFLGDFFAQTLRIKNMLRIASLAVILLVIVSETAFTSTLFILLNEKQALAGDYGDTFAITNRQAAHALQKYHTSPSYPEIYLNYFLPKEFLVGYLPLGKVVYPPYQTEKNLSNIEKGFSKDASDPRILNQLLSYYTLPENLTLPVIKTLYGKEQKDAAFQQIYSFAFNHYLSYRFKKIYQHNDFYIPYPQHWHSDETQSNHVIFYDETIALHFVQLNSKDPKEIEQPLLSPDDTTTVSLITLDDQVMHKSLCVQPNGTWCGTFYSPITINGGKYFLYAIYSPLNANKTIDKKTFTEESKVVEEIVSSITQTP